MLAALAPAHQVKRSFLSAKRAQSPDFRVIQSLTNTRSTSLTKNGQSLSAGIKLEAYEYSTASISRQFFKP